MGSKFTELVIDATDIDKLADFWCAVLGYEVLEREPDIVEIGDPSGALPTILFASVPEAKTVKNRLHIDVNPVDRDQDAEVERLITLGARRVDVGQGPDVSWVVLADIEDNEFCVLRTRVE